MKKFSFILTALLMAAAFSAFTPAKKTAEKKTTLLHWFQVNNNVVGSQIGTSAMEREDAISESCPDEGDVDCARGYASATNPGSTLNPALDFIKKDQQ